MPAFFFYISLVSGFMFSFVSGCFTLSIFYRKERKVFFTLEFLYKTQRTQSFFTQEVCVNAKFAELCLKNFVNFAFPIAIGIALFAVKKINLFNINLYPTK
jgi:hypothetical protein